MNPAYGNISITQGARHMGICSFKMVPRSWVETPIVIDPVTGNVETAVDLIAGKDWITFECTEPSMELAITPREAAAGDYFESNLKGVLTSNQVDTDYATLQTAVYEEWLVLYTYRYGSTRMLGNDKRACRLSLGQRANNSNNQEDMTVSLSLLSEKTPPFYVI